MRGQPHLVGEVHGDYFAAGAQVATTNTYAIHRDRLARAGLEAEFEALHDLALVQAEAARARHVLGGGTGRIAGSIGPLGASYRADVAPDHVAAVALYAEVARLLAPRVDLLIAETIASLAQARAVIEGASGLGVPQGVPLWLAFTVDDEDGRRLRSGEALADVVPMLDGVDAILANCSSPEAMPRALEVLGRSGLPFGAYANGFTQITKDFLKDAPTVDALAARRDMGPEVYSDHVMAWIDQGATIVGGCCEVGPAHIREIASRIRVPA